jgi:hypothetical protein
MKINLLADFFHEANIDKVLFAFNDAGFRQYFSNNNYGESIKAIGIILMCQDPRLHLKQRIRFSKKERILYMDIMLDLYEFIRINNDDRIRRVSKKLLEEIPPIIKKYKFEDFDLLRFESDLRNWLRESKLFN